MWQIDGETGNSVRLFFWGGGAPKSLQMVISAMKLKDAYSLEDSMVLAQKQKYRQIEQERKPRNKPMHLWVSYF